MSPCGHVANVFQNARDGHKGSFSACVTRGISRSWRVGGWLYLENEQEGAPEMGIWALSRGCHTGNGWRPIQVSGGI